MWEEEAKERVIRKERIRDKREKEAKRYLSTTFARRQRKGARGEIYEEVAKARGEGLQRKLQEASREK